MVGKAFLLLASAVAAMASEGFVKMDFRSEVISSRIEKRQSGDLSEPITLAINGSVYWLDLSIGTPAQKFSLQLDTGSSDLWVPAKAACSEKGGCPGGSFDSSSSSSYKLVQQGAFQIAYGDGTNDEGDYFTDVIQIGSDTIPAGTMTMGLANTIGDGQQVTNDGHGLVGIGYQSLETSAQLSPDGQLDQAPPTIYQALQKAGVINRAAYSLYLDDTEAGSGSIIFGGVDTTKYTGDLVALPVLVTPDQLSEYSAFNVALTGVSIKDGKGTRTLSQSGFGVPALLDSGTTSQQIPQDILTSIANGLGAVYTQGIYAVPCKYSSSDAAIVYNFGGSGGPSISVPLSALLRDLQTTFNNGEEACQLDMYPESGNGVILGDSFMRSGYFVYDVENNQIAIAAANLNATSTSALTAIPTGTSIPGCTSTNTFTDIATTASATDVGPTAAATATGQDGNPPSPTFDLGSATGTATGSSSTSSSTGSSNAGAQNIIGLGALGAAGLAFLL